MSKSKKIARSRHFHFFCSSYRAIFLPLYFQNNPARRRDPVPETCLS
jgi:hypothetical protein